MKRTEKDVERAVITAMRLAGWVVAKGPNEAGYLRFFAGLRKGFPDLVALGPQGRCVLLEIKAPSGSLRKEQRFVHEVLRELGHDVRVVRDLADIADLVPLQKTQTQKQEEV